MGWIVSYNRVGNAMPVYCVARSGSETFALVLTVKDVAKFTGRSLKSVRVACKEARDEGTSHFLD